MLIVFIHDGYSPYLEFTLRQARAAAPGADIVLLGDAANDRFPFLRHVDASSGALREAATDLERGYVHRSTNRRAFEVGCFARWFRLAAFLDAEGRADALVLDSDVMLYASDDTFRRTWLAGTPNLGLCVPDDQDAFRWIASPHVAYWRRETLADFCTFVLDSFAVGSETAAHYDAKWSHHLAHGQLGGVVDMTALYLFWQTVPPADRVNFLEVASGATCDQNVNDPENLVHGQYRMRGPVKHLAWQNSTPVGRDIIERREVQFHAVHFQGKGKEFIPAHYRGTAFPGQVALRARLAGEYKLRRLAARVLQPTRLALARLGARRS